MNWEFYPEPFDVTKPPPGPPNRTMSENPFSKAETKESKKQMQEYEIRMGEWRAVVHDKRRKNPGPPGA